MPASLDPRPDDARDHDALDALLLDAARRAAAYRRGLAQRAVQPDASALAGLAAFDTPLPARGLTPADVLARLDAQGSPATVATTAGRYFGFVTGGVLPAALAAHWLATAWDQNSALATAAPATTRIEAVALRWLVELFGLPADTRGAFVTGATMANLSALAAARHRVLAQVGWDVERDGLIGAPPVQVIVGEEAHPTLLKGLGLLGFGRGRVQRVPVDAQGRMRTEALPPVDGPTLVCAQAGNVNTGASDPLDALADALHGTGAWLHVDGAFGLWAAASPRLRAQVAGLARADSWATDAHKWLNVPYDCGVVLLRDTAALQAAMSVSAAYLPGTPAAVAPAATPVGPSIDWPSPSTMTPELSRRGRGVDAWAALASLGRDGVVDLIERHVAQAQRLAAGLAAGGLRILNDVVLNQVLAAFGDAERTQAVIAAVQAEGRCWGGPTLWQGQPAMRLSVSDAATSDADIDLAVQSILRQAAAPATGA